MRLRASLEPLATFARAPSLFSTFCRRFGVDAHLYAAKGSRGPEST